MIYLFWTFFLSLPEILLLVYLMIQNTENSKERISIPQNPNALTIRKNDRNKIILAPFWLYIHLTEIWNGILISSALSVKKPLILKKTKWRTFLLSPMKSLERLGCIRSLIFFQNKRLKTFAISNRNSMRSLLTDFMFMKKKRKEKWWWWCWWLR